MCVDKSSGCFAPLLCSAVYLAECEASRTSLEQEGQEALDSEFHINLGVLSGGPV